MVERQYYLDNIYIEEGNLYCDDPMTGFKFDLGPAPDKEAKDAKRFVFIQPLWWAQKACRIAPYGGAFAMCLWYAAGVERSKSIQLTPTKRERFGISKATTKRLLDAFEAAGLISVERAISHAPAITILVSPPKTS